MFCGGEHHDAESTANDIFSCKLDIKRNAPGVASLKCLQITFSPSGHQESERKPYHSLDFSCTICGYQMGTPYALNSHIYKFHRDNMLSKKFKSMGAFVRQYI